MNNQVKAKILKKVTKLMMKSIKFKSPSIKKFLSIKNHQT